MTVPGQPVYTLQNIGGRRYRIADPPTPGYYVTFRPQKDDPGKTEAELEQPNGKFVLTRVQTDGAGTRTQTADYNGPLNDILGTYHSWNL